MEGSYLRDTLLVLSAVEDSPGDAARVLALEEKGLGFAVLETEDLTVATDVQLALLQRRASVSLCASYSKYFHLVQTESRRVSPPQTPRVVGRVMASALYPAC